MYRSTRTRTSSFGEPLLAHVIPHGGDDDGIQNQLVVDGASRYELVARDARLEVEQGAAGPAAHPGAQHRESPGALSHSTRPAASRAATAKSSPSRVVIGRAPRGQVAGSGPAAFSLLVCHAPEAGDPHRHGRVRAEEVGEAALLEVDVAAQRIGDAQVRGPVLDVRGRRLGRLDLLERRGQGRRVARQLARRWRRPGTPGCGRRPSP